MQTKLEFNNKCTACGTARRKEDLVYSKEELKPYCANINVCNADHPNSYANVLAAGGSLTDMLIFKEAQIKFTERLMATATEEEKQVIKMMQSPTTLRIEEYDLAKHLIDFKESHSLKTVTEAFRDMIREHMEYTGKDSPTEDFIKPLNLEPVTPPIPYVQPEQITSDTLEQDSQPQKQEDDVETF